MMIRCPKCDRLGYLPDRLAPEARSLRCRKCKANFLTTELAVKDVSNQRRASEDSWPSVAMEAPGAGRSRQKAGPFLAEGRFGRFDDGAAPIRALGPGDSNYEMTFSIDDANGEPVEDWEKGDDDIFETEAPSSDEIEAINPAMAQSTRPSAGLHDVITAHGRRLGFGVIGFLVVSVLVIGYVVASSLGMAGDRSIPTSTHALIVASFGTIALLLIGAAMIFQGLLFAELVKLVRRMDDPGSRPRGR